MAVLEDEYENLAQLLESEISDQEEVDEEIDEREAKRLRVEENETRDAEKRKGKEKVEEKKEIEIVNNTESKNKNTNLIPRRIETGIFNTIPPELFLHILKFLSSEDLVSCSLVCSFLNYAAADESLWRRLYCMRWGLLTPSKSLRECAWKKLYIQESFGVPNAAKLAAKTRDEEDMIELVRDSLPEFREYYIQMQAAKRSQAPLPSQVKDDRIILDKTVQEQVSMWKKSKGLTDKVVSDHACSGKTCSYHRIGDVFVCEETGHVHVCDENCREIVLDPDNQLFVCTISGQCFDRLLSPAEVDADSEQQQGGALDEAEPLMGYGALAKYYLLGYNCADEKELKAVFRFC